MASSSSSSIERIVDPACPNAANPFHNCRHYCRRGSPGTAASGIRLGSSLFVAKSKENKYSVERRNVDPSCIKASNPFHECRDSCKKSNYHSSNSHEVKSAVAVNGRNKGVETAERSHVNPNCANATNPFHKCSESCNRKIKHKI